MAAGRNVGRKPDPQLEMRVYEAAIAIYAERGWSGFTLDAVARRARVGKAALYLRWSSKAAVLESALLSNKPRQRNVDTGTLRGDLISTAQDTLDNLRGEIGQAISRVDVEAKMYPEVLGKVRDAYTRFVIGGGRTIIQRAIERGELPSDASTAMLLDMLAGTIQHHVTHLPSNREAAFWENAEQYVEVVVDLVIQTASSEAARRQIPTRVHP